MVGKNTKLGCNYRCQIKSLERKTKPKYEYKTSTSVLIKHDNYPEIFRSCISEYLIKANNPSLQEFYELIESFPRRNLLRRWVKGGVYENSFSVIPSQIAKCTHLSSSLKYYNFKEVFQASDPEFAQAGIAAVLAQFNIDCLTEKNKRIILICDETPFFIKSNFSFFKFTTANVRKFGHSVILISQLLSDLVVDNDFGILENSPIRFLFSLDSRSDYFKNVLKLTDLQIEKLKSLRSIPKQFSEVLLQDSNGAKKLKIQVTNKEYWKLTSNSEDNQKLEKLMAYVPKLKLEEALQCLSIT